jgi:hypothetical protein
MPNFPDAGVPESTLLLRRIAVAVEKLAGMLPAVRPPAAVGPPAAAPPRRWPQPVQPPQGAQHYPQDRQEGYGGGPRVAPDSDLDGQHGDPTVRAKSPRDWTGPDMQGRRFSECPAEYLDLVASRLDYFASDNQSKGEDQKARYNRLDAARARGWALRIRAGYQPQRQPGMDDGDPGPSDFGGPDLPF